MKTAKWQQFHQIFSQSLTHTVNLLLQNIYWHVSYNLWSENFNTLQMITSSPQNKTAQLHQVVF